MNRRTFLTTTAQASSFLAFGAVPFIEKNTDSADVIVVGAGLAGLNAAMILESQGKSVLVLEASKRIGGRLYTLDDVAWKPDTGGVQVGDGYKRLVAIAQKLNVGLVDEPRSNADTLICLGGERIQSSEWEASAFNKLLDSEKKILPSLLESTLLRGQSPLQTLDDWRSEKFAAMDISIAAYLKSKGVSDEALRLIEIASDTPGLDKTSVLNNFRSSTLFAKGGFTKSMMIQGGSSRLPEAMAKSLKQPVRLGKIVTSIAQRNDGVVLTCSDRSTFKAKNVVMAVPFTTLRKISMIPAITGVQAQAVRSLQYTTISQIHVAVKKAFWLDDGLPPTMWTDSPLERIFVYPEADGKPARMLCWINGEGARKFDTLSEKDVLALVQAEMKRLRPASEGALEVTRINSWGKNPFAGGSYVKFAPGQITKFALHLAMPHQNIVFAGEHTAMRFTGMEGALESGERAAGQIL
ncbi:MAG: NAD(P)/FAD-dependent oxidoreductase [Candidatus Kapabacteria bacterium]|jgi:monoamine oxidase|nr:NAD(P)/FAD-dependent oxidoreductase [Candidatus Kapabacteria bacterium]